ncbi:hypothetical protein WJX73_006493 [Symbiochloris irregularis]|uniref:Brix domain-containing protein n=1 Tax=Symbiochloris irregularis TaxID=706552 RepID=A0AAW1NU21_9CHLO
MGSGPYRKKKRTHLPEDPNAKKADVRSFVFWRGKFGVVLKALEADLRKLLAPNTAKNLKESRRNQLKDFVHIAGPLGITQFVILTATEHSSYLRLAKTPRGPTCTLRIHGYALMRDVAAALTRPSQLEGVYGAPPLVVLNNFGAGGEALTLAGTLFQGLFPSINVQSTQLRSCKRVVLLSYNAETRRISFRHYSISTAPSGITKGAKALVAGRALPNLANMQDVSELLTKSGYGSESEGEEAAESRVTLNQNLGRGNIAERQSRVKLQEIGPRLELEVVKAEEGLCSGRVLFHAHVQKDAEAAEQQQAAVEETEATQEERERMRAARRRQQEENVRKKTALKRKVSEAPPTGKGSTKAKEQAAKKRQKQWWESNDVNLAQEPDDDTAYYREAVGAEPDDDFIASRGAIGRDLDMQPD